MWSATFNFILALLIFTCNMLVLVAIASCARLHSPFHLLSTNLWLCNVISAVVTIFFSHTRAPLSSIPCSSSSLPTALTDSSTSSPLLLSKDMKGGANGLSPMDTQQYFGPHSTAVLLNSTVSLLSLLAIGVVHALYTHGYRLSKAQSSRVLMTTWLLAFLLLVADFILLRIGTSSLSLVLPFHLALLSVLLLLNLLLHPTNLIILSKCASPPQQPPSPTELQRGVVVEECTTASLWLLLNSLSFVIIAMMVVWDVRSGQEGTEHALGIEMAAYSVHCVANPLIAIIRDRRLEAAIARLLRTTKRQPTVEDDLITALMRDPPPPYTL